MQTARYEYGAPNHKKRMKKSSLKYVGSKAVRALLDRYACPVTFHVVRMRLLGNIATPKLDASPIKTIERLWGGEMPVFDNVGAVNELFETMMNLWNELTKHQSGVKPVRLARMAAKTDREGLRLFCQTRTEELEGFIDGLFGDEEAIDLPERANEALNHLTDINAMLHGILDLVAREPAPSASEEDTARTMTCATGLCNAIRVLILRREPSPLPVAKPTGFTMVALTALACKIAPICLIPFYRASLG